MTPNSYLQLLDARVAGLRCLTPGDRSLPRVREEGGETWLVKRSSIYGAPDLFESQPDAQRSFDLARGGQLDVFLKVRRSRKGVAEVASYRIAIRGLPTPNENHVSSLRYDKSQGQPRRGWDDELGDNPQHPWRHLHLNFDASQAANVLRLPTGEVDPIVILASFDYWYCATYEV